MDLISFIFGILLVVVVIVIAIAIAGFVMIIKMKKKYNEQIQTVDIRIDESIRYTDENMKGTRAYIDSRIDKLISQLK